MKKRVLSLMMALLLLWQLIPSVCLAAGGTADSSFVLAAATAGKVLIEPVAVSYTGSETLAQALKKSGYDLEGRKPCKLYAISIESLRLRNRQSPGIILGVSDLSCCKQASQ